MVVLNVLTVLLLALIATRQAKYVWWSLVLILGLLAYNLYEKTLEGRQRLLAIHAVPKHTVVSVIEGTRAFLLADEAFLQDRRNVSFRLNNFWAQRGITDTTKLRFFERQQG